MKINDFVAKGAKEKDELEKKLEGFKLEKVLSLWYFVYATSKASIMGSKN